MLAVTKLYIVTVRHRSENCASIGIAIGSFSHNDLAALAIRNVVLCCSNECSNFFQILFIRFVEMHIMLTVHIEHGNYFIVLNDRHNDLRL